MAYVVPRHGEFATIDGVEYPCAFLSGTNAVRLVSRAAENPDPELYQWNADWKVWLAELPAERCERVVAVNSYAKYQGHRCEVDAIGPDGSAELIYADWNGAWARNSGFDQTDPGTYRKSVPVSELYDFHEEHLDLLFDTWRSAEIS
jgi:hypothetical protein